MSFKRINISLLNYIKHLPGQELVIFSPYIRLSALKKILVDHELDSMSIVTTWTIKDLIMGYSDLELYLYCQDRGINLYLNQRIHLKVLTDFHSAIIGSANITEKGLGLVENHNYEFMTKVEHLDLQEQIYLRKILQEAILIDDEIYEQYKKCCEDNCDLAEILQIEEPHLIKRNQCFLISNLPMSRSIETFYEYYCGNLEYQIDHKDDYDCAIHDLALYSLPFGLKSDEFSQALKQSFFKQPFIEALVSFIKVQPRYFGEIKEWVQKTCENVPIPSRRDLTGNVQVLYEWLKELGADQYTIDRPSHSERISFREVTNA